MLVPEGFITCTVYEVLCPQIFDMAKGKTRHKQTHKKTKTKAVKANTAAVKRRQPTFLGFSLSCKSNWPMPLQLTPSHHGIPCLSCMKAHTDTTQSLIRGSFIGRNLKKKKKQGPVTKAITPLGSHHQQHKKRSNTLMALKSLQA